MTAVFPIFLIDGGDVSFVAHRSALAAWEPFLADEPVRFLDALARPLRLVIGTVGSGHRPLRASHEAVVDVEVLVGEPDEDFLRTALTSYLVATGQSVPAHADIREFVESAVKRIR
jgi:hypothetical protein